MGQARGFSAAWSQCFENLMKLVDPLPVNGTIMYSTSCSKLLFFQPFSPLNSSLPAPSCLLPAGLSS